MEHNQFDLRQAFLRAKMENQLREMKARNPRFSLRAFARQLGISPAALCQFLSGKRRLGKNNFFKIGEWIKAHSIQGIETAAPLAETRAHLFASLKQDPEIQWYHLAILSIESQYGAWNQPDQISVHLGITTEEAQGALEYLAQKRHALCATSTVLIPMHAAN